MLNALLSGGFGDPVERFDSLDLRFTGVVSVAGPAPNAAGMLPCCCSSSLLLFLFIINRINVAFLRFRAPSKCVSDGEVGNLSPRLAEVEPLPTWDVVTSNECCGVAQEVSPRGDGSNVRVLGVMIGDCSAELTHIGSEPADAILLSTDLAEEVETVIFAARSDATTSMAKRLVF